MEIKPAIWRHFKGHEVRVIGVAKHTETLEDYVYYEHLGENEKSQFWVRPLKMFTEIVDKPELNYHGPRFVLVREA